MRVYMSVRAFTRIAAGGGGLLAAGFVDRALTPQTRPLSTAAAAAGTLGHIRLYQYQVALAEERSRPRLPSRA